MTVSIISGIPVYAGPTDIVTSVVAPNINGGFGTLAIGDITGLQAALDAKLDDVLGTIGALNVAATGAELNFLSGVTANIQTQLDGKLMLTGGTLTGDLLFDSATQLLIDFGTTLLPGLAFNGDSDTGIWWPAANTIGFATAGSDVLHMLPSGLLRVQTGGYEALVVADDDVPNKKYVDDAIAAATSGPFLPLAGGVMAGTIDMEGNLIILDADGDSTIGSALDDVLEVILGGVVDLRVDNTCLDLVTPKPIKNVTNPTNPQDAATKDYVDTEIVALNLGGTGPFLQLSGGTMTGALDMGTNLINNVIDPAAAQDAATKNYVDTEIVALNLGGTGPFLQLSGGTMTGAIDLGGFAITNLLDPVNPQDAVTRAFADATYISTTGPAGPLGGDLDAGGFKIVNLANPTNPQDAATKDYVDSNFLNLDGSSAMTGDIDVGGNLITNLAAATANDEAVILGQANSLYFRLDGSSAMLANANIGGFKLENVANPTANQDAVTLAHADSNYLRADGTTAATGNLNLATNRIINLGNPSVAQDAATKNYVDTEITSLNLGGSGPFLQLAGGTMVGDITMDSNTQVLADDGNSAAPGYAFDSSPSTGMLWDGINIQLSLASSPALTIAPSSGANEIDVHGRKVTGADDPTDPSDLVTKNFLDNAAFVKVLARVPGVDLMVTGTTSLFTVPVATMNIITQIIFRTTSYVPGPTPTNPEISVGTSGPNYNNIVVDNTVLDWGGTAGAGDQAVHVAPKNGAETPNAGSEVKLQVDTAGGGSFSSLVVEVIVLGIELQ